MLGKIADFGFKNKVFTLFALLIIILMGLFCFNNLQKFEDPVMTSRVVRITTGYPGMSVSRMTKLIARPVEKKINELQEAKYIVSTIRRGQVTTLVMIDDAIKNVKPYVQDLRNKLNDIILPPGTTKPRFDMGFSKIAFATIAIPFPDNFSIKKMDFIVDGAQRFFKSRFESIHSTEVFGLPKQKYYVQLSSAKLAHYGLKVADIENQLKEQHLFSTGGTVETAGQRITVIPESELSGVKGLANVFIKTPLGAQLISLSDIANITVSEAKPMANRVFFNGQRSVILGLYPGRNANLLKLGSAVKASIPLLQKRMPEDLKLQFANFRPQIIADSLHEFAFNLYLAMIIVLVSVVSMLTVRAGILVGLTIPLSMLMTVIFMYYFNIPLERMTLAGLIISLGLLIDNGMVMVEDTRFLMDQGKDPVSAAKTVSRKLAAPLLVSQLTTILAFAPPLLAANGASEYVGGISKTVLIVLLSSWFLSQWALPLLCSLFLKPTPAHKVKTQEQIFSRPMFRFYKFGLTKVLNHRLLFVFVVMACFYGALQLTPWVKLDFMPKFETQQLYIKITTPSGTALPYVLSRAKKIQRYLFDQKLNPNVLNVSLYAGANGPRLTALNDILLSTNQAYLLIKIKPLSDRQLSILESRYRQFVGENITDVKVNVGRLLGLMSEPGKVQVNILGPDPERLYQYGLQLENALAKIPHTYGVSNSWGNLTPSVRLTLNRYALKRAGISPKDIVDTVQHYFDGKTLSQIHHGLNLIPIEFRLSRSERVNLSRLGSLQIYSSMLKKKVALRDMATFKLHYKLSIVDTFQRENSIHVSGFNLVLGVSEALKRLQPAIEQLKLPAGYKIKIRGESEDSAEANEALFGSALPCIAAIFLILCYQFKSIRKMIILFTVLPLAIFGVILGLVITQVPFGFMPTFGVIALIGLVINDGVILIEAITHGQQDGLNVRDSLLRAAQERLRPILLTTITTVFGMLPLIFNGGPLWEGLAICFASGELVSTLLLLFFVPVMYSLFFRYWRKAGTVYL